jgi:hypothetical protein
VINDLQDFLTRELTKAVRLVEGVPNDVRQVMGQALKGALDFVINDIHPEGDNVPNFMDLLPMFRANVGELLFERLSKLEYTNEGIISQVVE